MDGQGGERREGREEEGRAGQRPDNDRVADLVGGSGLWGHRGLQKDTHTMSHKPVRALCSLLPFAHPFTWSWERSAKTALRPWTRSLSMSCRCRSYSRNGSTCWCACIDKVWCQCQCQCGWMLVRYVPGSSPIDHPILACDTWMASPSPAPLVRGRHTRASIRQASPLVSSRAGGSIVASNPSGTQRRPHTWHGTMRMCAKGAVRRGYGRWQKEQGRARRSRRTDAADAAVAVVVPAPSAPAPRHRRRRRP